MKKKILITLGAYSLVFLLGGIYIVTTIESHTTKIYNLLQLYRVEKQRRLLLFNLKNVQSDVSIRRTDHSRSVDAIVSHVQSLQHIGNLCFNCHHADDIVKRLRKLEKGIDEYKEIISRVLTIRANRNRLLAEDEKAYRTAEQLFHEVDEMVHVATAKLSKKTEQSIHDISRAKLILFMVVGITPFLAGAFGFIFIKGFTRPLKVLLKATQKIKGGKLDYRITGLRNEFGEVAASFNEMASHMEKGTRRLEDQTAELEHAHHEMSIFCDVLKQIGVQQTLGGVGSFLIKELEPIVKSTYMALYVFSSDHHTLFAMSDRGGIQAFTAPELIRTASDILDELRVTATPPQKPFTSPLLPADFPAEGRQTIIPLRIQGYIDGAFVIVCPPDCLCDEIKFNLVTLILEQASGTIERAVLQEEKIRTLEERIESMSGYSELIGKDPQMQTIYRLIEDIAHTDATVLIQGETGTGKEMVARAIYRQSLRKDKPFIVINCSAYPATLLESELFGHEKGAFTGAIRQKIGRFEQAHGGTVFLDEIGEVPPSAQIKLLRVLQTQKFERLGGEQTVSVDVRILAATNKDLFQETKSGNFREDLYYRLNVIPINLPPLRSRRNDVPMLARHFQRKLSMGHGADRKEFSSSAMKHLLDYHWPGNVRELENSVEHAVVLARGRRIEVSDLPSAISQAGLGNGPINDRGTIVENEKALLKKILQDCNGNKKAAAQCLGISRNTLYRKLHKYQITPPGPHINN